ncbi:MAG: hypothetical protein ABIK89_07275, partial [Planctomycetota bacterium]
MQELIIPVVVANWPAKASKVEVVLQLTGAEEHLRRCVQAIRRLRDAGYNRVIVVTDHGFFHWRPEE